jgi:hypothetical protein
MRCPSGISLVNYRMIIVRAIIDAGVSLGCDIALVVGVNFWVCVIYESLPYSERSLMSLEAP